MTSTPRPWTWEKEPNGMTFGIWHDDTNIGEVLDADDAAVLVQAVNAHDDLVAALEEQIKPRARGWKVTDWDIRDENARAALAKANAS